MAVADSIRVLAEPISIVAPAKINLLLAVIGPNADGYHDLISVVLPFADGDRIHLAASTSDQDELQCTGFAVGGHPEDNLVLKALRLWREAAGVAVPPLRVILEKRIPVGGGFGGGSGDAVAILRWLDEHRGQSGERLAPRLAPLLGSDCPLFLDGGPVVMEGRGERVRPLGDPAQRSLSGWKLLLFAPPLPVSTAGVFQRMRQRRVDYIEEAPVREQLATWEAGVLPLREVRLNNLEEAAGEKYLPLSAFWKEVRASRDWVGGMTGSGSGGFFLWPENGDAAEVRDWVLARFGPETFWVETPILRPHL